MDNSFLHRKKLLLVDDEPELLKMVSDILKDAGFEAVLTAASVKEAVMVAKQEKPDLMILDVMLPDGDGFSLMEQLRTFTDVPVIFLTAKDEAADKLAGLGLGADDYITKPFDMEEVLARIESNLRRIQFQNSTPSSLKCNDLVLDLDGNRAMLQGAELPLTAKEFAILELLMKYPDKIFSKANLFQSVWNTEYISEDNTLNVHISNLRNKMKAICPDKEFIDTVWGIGYRLHKAEG